MTKWFFALCLFATVAVMGETENIRRTQSIWHNPHSGIVARVYFDSHCFEGKPPLCIRPRPYFGALCVFTQTGRFVASVSGNIDGVFTAYLKPGTYVVVPQDPDLVAFAAAVAVEFKQFAPATIVLPWNADQ